MSRPARVSVYVILALTVLAAPRKGIARHQSSSTAQFQTSDRCMVCHNGMTSSSGEQLSFGREWRVSIMANAARDPYWQASVRRETVDYPGSTSAIEDECAACHMPISRYEAKLRGQPGAVFSLLAMNRRSESARQAMDGVSCSVCHQIGAANPGLPESFNGEFTLNPPDQHGFRPVYGPFTVENGLARVMRSSSEGYNPVKDTHIQQSELCATCHTLYTEPLKTEGNGGARLPEQMPYQEWLHSSYRDTKSCQTCHTVELKSPAPITRVLGEPREGVRRHTFIGGNFAMQRLFSRFSAELGVPELAGDFNAAAARTEEFLQTQAVRLSIADAAVSDGRLRIGITLRNLSGHKLPSGYPSRRLWVHLMVRNRSGAIVFESGALNADGSIRGNDNDADASKFERHYEEITSADQVQVYESILGNSHGQVTTGLLSAVSYLKDNRLLPDGFNKASAGKDIAVIGEAVRDADFTGAGDSISYSIPWDEPDQTFEIEVEALYQPIAYRWAANLKVYGEDEPRRFGRYYDTLNAGSAVRLARATLKSQQQAGGFIQ